MRFGTSFAFFAALSLLFLSLVASAAQPETFVLYLKNGDRITGTVVAEDTNRVVLTNLWLKELAVPLTQIERRQKLPALLTSTPAPGKTNAVVAVQPGPTVPAISTPPPVPSATSTNKHWKAELRVGADFLLGATDQQIYSGRAKLTYAQPYKAHPKQFFRNILDYSVDYGRTEGIVSANRMNGANKTDFDIGRRFFLYNLGGVGYDHIRKINLRYEIGPGVGYHLLQRTNFVVDLETGMDYQAQFLADGTTRKDFFPRLAEDLTWKINSHFNLTESLEFFPPMASEEYRIRFESTLSYALWQNISLNLSVLDQYDSVPAVDVPQNDLQIRSSIGVTF